MSFSTTTIRVFQQQKTAQPLAIFLTNTCLRSEVGTQSLSKLDNVFFLLEAMYNYNKNKESHHDLLKPALFSISLQEVDFTSSYYDNSRKTFSFDDTVHSIDEDKIMTPVDFDCGNTFYSQAPTNLIRISQKLKKLAMSCKNPTFNQVTVDVTAFLIRIIPLTSFCPPQFMRHGFSSSFVTQPHSW